MTASLKDKLSAALPLSFKFSLKCALRRFGVGRERGPGPVAPVHVPSFDARDFRRMMDEAAARVAALTPGSRVSVSLIVRARGDGEHALRCLSSLLGEVDFAETEIILEGDAPGSETNKLVSRCGDRVRLGAAEARGEYLIFLEGDAAALSGWLEELVNTARSYHGAGAVGSLSLREDGRIGEAGSIVWRTGEVTRYGEGESPDDSRFNFAREVDCCAGAALLVRRDLFERLGGFDARYASSVYAFADICMGVRSSGYKVVYQPLARVVRREGAGEVDEGRDRETFREKWATALERDHLPTGAGAEQEANRKWDVQVAVFDDLIPTPDRDAGSARMMFILRALSQWSQPVFFTMGKRLWPEYEKLLWREGIETASALDYKRLLRQRRFRAAVLSRPAVAGALLGPVRRAARGLKIVYDMLDVHHLRATREAALTGDARAAREAETLRQLETRLARAVDLLWCGSPPDQQIMARIAPGVPSVVVPTVHELHGRGRPFAERAHLLFVGNFRHRPNVDAVHFLAREVLPLVRASLAGVELLVVGDNAPPEFEGYAEGGVRLLGYVPDLAPVMDGCRVFVAPIRFGSGVNGKIGESLSYGLPAVTTTVGAEGWNFTGDEQVLIEDAPEDFAAAVARLYTDAALWQRLADGGYRHIADNYTPEVVGRIINDSLKTVGPSRG